MSTIDPLPTFDFTEEELRVAGIEFEQSCRRGMEKLERKWREADRTVAWIDTEPKWLPLFDWECDPDAPLLPRPAMPCRRTWRFTLIGGGQLRTTEHWIANPDPDQFLGPTWNSKTTVKIAGHGDGLRVAYGEIHSVLYEMQADAIVLNGQGEAVQTLANRAAATLQLLSTATGNCTPPDRDRFFALLDGARGCCCCRRPLRDEISKLLAIGPDCARALGVPHTREAASRRLQLRAQMLGEASEDRNSYARKSQ